jgi:hypothetical protein
MSVAFSASLPLLRYKIRGWRSRSKRPELAVPLRVENLMDLRVAKSSVMSLFGTYWNRNCPLAALMHAWPAVVLLYSGVPCDVNC